MDETMRDDFPADEKQESGIRQTNHQRKKRKTQDLKAHLATKAHNSHPGVAPASPGLMANLRLGRKTANGVRILISEGEPPEIVVDAYITVKYGLRIPDVCWDVQEAVKDQIERFTGYAIKGVNIYVQGITFAEKKEAQEGGEAEPEFPSVDEA